MAYKFRIFEFCDFWISVSWKIFSVSWNFLSFEQIFAQFLKISLLKIKFLMKFWQIYRKNVDFCHIWSKIWPIPSLKIWYFWVSAFFLSFGKILALSFSKILSKKKPELWHLNELELSVNISTLSFKSFKFELYYLVFDLQKLKPLWCHFWSGYLIQQLLCFVLMCIA